MSTVANVEMAKAWDGEEGDRWADNAERYEATGRRHWQRFLEGGFIGAEDRVLDIGCGTGRSTCDVARLAAQGSALGVDLSSRMLARARQRSQDQGLTNVSFVQADAQVHPFDESAFDVAMSSFGAMFFEDPVAAFSNIGRALRPDGRLALLAWRALHRNDWLTAFREVLAAGRDLPEPPLGAPGPFGLAEPDGVRAILTEAQPGFGDVELAEINEPIELGADAEDAFPFVRTMGIVRGLTQDLDDTTKARVLDGLRQMLVAHETSDGVLFGSSAWLISARRR